MARDLAFERGWMKVLGLMEFLWDLDWALK